jgi:RHS repeat-associated protein
MSTVNTSDGETLTYSYSGRLLTSVVAGGSIGSTVGTSYDNDFRPSAESVNGNAVAFGYDADGLMTQLGALTITRDPGNGLVAGTAIGSVSDVRQQNVFGESLDRETKYGATSLFKETFTRDQLGRLETKTETIAGNTSIYNYSYDAAGRVWQVLQNGALSATYLYDTSGNRVSKTTVAGTENGTVDVQDRLTAHGRFSFTYTANGEVRTKTDTATGAVTTYGYDGFGNLRRVDLPDGRMIQYAIDGLGRRIAKKINGAIVRRWTYRDPLTPVAELDAAGGVVSRIVGGEYLVKGGVTYRIVKDHQGSPRMVVNSATGAIAQRMDFDEFGIVRSDSAPGFQPFGFAGGLYDPDTGLVRFGVRDYDADVGRWMAKDPILFSGGQANIYAYVANDPINRRDPTGLGWGAITDCFAKGAAVGALGAIGVVVVAAAAATVLPVAVVTTALGVAAGVGAAAFAVDVGWSAAAGNWNRIAYDSGSFLGGWIAGGASGRLTARLVNGVKSPPWSIKSDRAQRFNKDLGSIRDWLGTGPNPGSAAAVTAVSGVGAARAVRAPCAGDCD